MTIYGLAVCTKGPQTSTGFPYSPLTARPVGSLREHGSQSLYGVAFHGAACFNLLVSLGAFSQQCVKHKRRMHLSQDSPNKDKYIDWLTRKLEDDPSGSTIYYSKYGHFGRFSRVPFLIQKPVVISPLRSNTSICFCCSVCACVRACVRVKKLESRISPNIFENLIHSHALVTL